MRFKAIAAILIIGFLVFTGTYYFFLTHQVDIGGDLVFQASYASGSLAVYEVREPFETTSGRILPSATRCGYIFLGRSESNISMRKGDQVLQIFRGAFVRPVQPFDQPPTIESDPIRGDVTTVVIARDIQRGPR
jgi:hypothetical protein